MKSINTLFLKFPAGKFFKKATGHKEAVELEACFIQALRNEIKC